MLAARAARARDRGEGPRLGRLVREPIVAERGVEPAVAARAGAVRALLRLRRVLVRHLPKHRQVQGSVRVAGEDAARRVDGRLVAGACGVGERREAVLVPRRRGETLPAIYILYINN